MRGKTFGSCFGWTLPFYNRLPDRLDMRTARAGRDEGNRVRVINTDITLDPRNVESRSQPCISISQMYRMKRSEAIRTGPRDRGAVADHALKGRLLWESFGR